MSFAVAHYYTTKPYFFGPLPKSLDAQRKINIFDFIKMILFGGSTLLTPDPIDIEVTKPVTIKLESSISAINKGAAVGIDVSQYITSENVVEGLREIGNLYPDGCVKATLFSNNNKKVVLNRSSGSWGANKKMIRLSSKNGVRTDLKFTSIELSSCKIIQKAEVVWYNFSE